MKYLQYIVILIAILQFVSSNSVDLSSYSNSDKIIQTNIDLDLTIDFSIQTVYGSAQITGTVVAESESQLILDTRNLDIKIVSDAKGNFLNFNIKEQPEHPLGSPLIISLGRTYLKGETVSVIVYYKTIPNQSSGALQWLTPDQTLGKQYPFVYTQCEAIQCRTLLPCQDSPGAKVYVTARLTVPKPLTALLAGVQSAEPQVNGDSQTFTYRSPNPIPSYLIAFAAGALEYRSLGKRTGVFAEKEIVEKAQYEFEDTEQYVSTAETYLNQPYAWQVYNILVLPPGFPYGGMENPCLTFVTPALIAGDKSLANVIAHEISHSWTGNLVTNQNWQHFWLNEGFTTFLQRKITEIIYGIDMYNLEANIGYASLVADIKNFGESSSYTSLFPDIKDHDPDDSFSTVPYEKGFTFLYYLQSLVGKPNFQKIMQVYIDTYKLKSINTEDFKSTFNNQVNRLYPNSEESNSILKQVDWDSWITKPGYPIKTFDYSSDLIKTAKAFADAFISRNPPSDSKKTFDSWHTNTKLIFLNNLLDRINEVSDEVYNNLRDSLQLYTKQNAEVLNLWIQVALLRKRTDIIQYAQDFLSKNGRMKYIRPIYVAFYIFNKDEAKKTFNANKNIYHPIAVRLILQDFDKLGNNSINFLA